MKVLLATAFLSVLIFSFSGIAERKCERGASIFVTPNANSRETYFSIHNVKAAQRMATGKGVKVAILDWMFGFDIHKKLYAGGKNLTQSKKSDYLFRKRSHHGYWMALALKEIAPDAKVYALQVVSEDKTKRSQTIAKAIDWAIKNKMDVLTYSQRAFSDKEREIVDKAVEKAVKNKIATTFIHYPHPSNLFPTGLFNYEATKYKRKPDLNIFHYDFNSTKAFTLNMLDRESCIGADKYKPFLSISSTSPVLAGFVALLKEIDNTLSPNEYKKILAETSKGKVFQGALAQHTVDIYEAAKWLQVLKKKRDK